jgi:tetratricopeptide (TPR) repeat protein
VSQALALNPNFALAHNFKADVLMLQGRNDEAIAEDERALVLDPAVVNAYASMGLAYSSLGQFEKSLEFLTRRSG